MKVVFVFQIEETRAMRRLYQFQVVRFQKTKITGKSRLFAVNLEAEFSDTPLKINMEHYHRGLEGHFPF